VRLMVCLPITRSPDLPITRSPDLPITRSPDLPITRSPDLPITRSPDHPILSSAFIFIPVFRKIFLPRAWNKSPAVWFCIAKSLNVISKDGLHKNYKSNKEKLS
jgi:hypothetical protein